MADAVPQQQDLKLFNGAFLVWRLNSKGYARKHGSLRVMKERHGTFAEAEAEACRMNLQYPESTFVVLHELARVKMVDAVALDVAA